MLRRGIFSREGKGKGGEDVTYTVLRSDRKTVALQIKNGSVLVRAPKQMREEAIRRFVLEHTDWIEKQLARLAEKERAMAEVKPLTYEELLALAERARRVIPGRVRYYAERLGVSYGRITIRHQKTRWGSCSSSGNLNFNCLLMLAPPEVLDSVVVHELCHRKHMNHSKEFWNMIENILPDYKEHRKWLKENGHTLRC